MNSNIGFARFGVVPDIDFALVVIRSGVGGSLKYAFTSTAIADHSQTSGRYVAWPMIARAANGELLVVFSGDREGHVCPFGNKTFSMRSADDGVSWSQPS